MSKLENQMGVRIRPLFANLVTFTNILAVLATAWSIYLHYMAASKGIFYKIIFIMGVHFHFVCLDCVNESPGM